MPFVAGFLGRPKGRLLRHLLQQRFPGAPDIGLPEGEGEGGGNGEDGDGDEGIWGPGIGHRPGHPIYPTLPPKDEWPELPPWLQPGVGLPIPPTPEFPMVPLPPDPEIDPPDIWPPLPRPPEFPDLSGKSLILACFFVSRHVRVFRYVVVDHAEAKTKFEKAMAWLKAHWPAGGIAGRPPQRPGG